MTSYRVEIDRDECLSAGKCVASFGAAFGFDDDEIAVVLPGAAEIGDEKLLRAARLCPNQAIKLFDAHGEPIDVR